MRINQTPSRIDLMRTGSAIALTGRVLARYGLAVVIAWIGALKFTSAEAYGIAPLVSTSPLLSWVYDLFTIEDFSALLGIVELSTAVLLATRPWWPKASAIGSAVAVGLFLATLSFVFSAPEVGEAASGGFPALSLTGQFLIKDLVLIAVAVWTLGDALRAGAEARADITPASYPAVAGRVVDE